MKSLILQTLYDKVSFSKDAANNLYSIADKTNSPELEALLFCDKKRQIIQKSVFYKDGFYPHAFFDKAKAKFDENNICHAHGFAALYLSYFEKSYNLAKTLNLNNQTFIDTLSVVLLEIKNILNQKEPYFDYIFFANYIVLNILRLGSLDFQNGIFDYCYNGIPKGQRVIFMHIPKGADISQKSRQISYDLCRQTFGKGHLVCDSWLLFPEHKNMLDKNDNIISLMSDFNIISQSTTKNYDELFHIFGNNADFSDISSLADKSRLQKAYIQRIQKALPVGSAVGIKNI
jgi:hypothetical protein